MKIISKVTPQIIKEIQESIWGKNDEIWQSEIITEEIKNKWYKSFMSIIEDLNISTLCQADQQTLNKIFNIIVNFRI